ncbi:hypothetical protein VSR69_45365 [Paraburkholderia phytofirmans]
MKRFVQGDNFNGVFHMQASLDLGVRGHVLDLLQQGGKTDDKLVSVLVNRVCDIPLLPWIQFGALVQFRCVDLLPSTF